MTSTAETLSVPETPTTKKWSGSGRMRGRKLLKFIAGKISPAIRGSGKKGERRRGKGRGKKHSTGPQHSSTAPRPRKLSSALAVVLYPTDSPRTSQASIDVSTRSYEVEDDEHESLNNASTTASATEPHDLTVTVPSTPPKRSNNSNNKPQHRIRANTKSEGDFNNNNDNSGGGEDELARGKGLKRLSSPLFASNRTAFSLNARDRRSMDALWDKMHRPRHGR